MQISDIELETRTCDGGCGKTFRVMPNSPHRQASANCAWFCKGKKRTNEEIRRGNRHGITLTKTQKEFNRPAEDRVIRTDDGRMPNILTADDLKKLHDIL